MLNHRLLVRTARKLSRGGFTLVELLVVIGIIAILAGVALGPITSGIEKAKESAGLQSARSINLLLFQYSTDNNNVYPSGTAAAPGTGHGIAIQLLQNKYANDPTIFAMGSTTHYVAGGTQDFSDFKDTNISWDFTGVQGSPITGITSSSSDLVPSVFCTGETIPAYAPNTQLNLTLSGTGPFAKNGIAVAYKGNSAFFLKGTLSGTGSVVSNFISSSFNDTASYVQIKP